MMNCVLKPYLGIFCNVYIDDIIVYSRSKQEHTEHLAKVFRSALSNADLKINEKQGDFFQPKVVFLGRVFDGATKSTKQESVHRISTLTKPHDLHSLRVFLGLAGHFRAFITDFAKMTKCLTELTKKDVTFICSDECEEVYQELVRRISSDPVLTLPDFSLPFEMNTDASHYGTGAVLYQRHCSSPLNRQLRVVGYYSYTFNATQLNYSTTEKEALAVLMAVLYFRSYIDGRKFKLYTDHQALTYLLSPSEPRGKLARWINELQQYDFEVIHRAGSGLTDADALSRLAVEVPHEVLNVTKLWEGCERLQFANGRFVVPETLVPKVLHMYHDTPDSGGHDGFWRTYNKLLQRFTWNNMKRDVDNYVRSCHLCQVNKAMYRPRPDALVLPLHSDTPFKVVHVDFAELKKKSEGVRQTQSFVVAIDQCTRMVAARPGKEDTNSVIALLDRAMFSELKVVVSDNGRALMSNKFQQWADSRGVVLRHCSPYHPQANGLAERVIRDIKQFMSMYPNFRGGWKCCLEAAVAHQNRTHTTSLRCSPHFAAYGEVPKLSADQELGISDKLQLTERPKTIEERSRYRAAMKRQFDKRHHGHIPDIKLNDFELVTKGLPGTDVQILGPFQVVKTCVQQGLLKTVGYMNSGQLEIAAVSNIIPYHPRRGET